MMFGSCTDVKRQKLASREMGRQGESGEKQGNRKAEKQGIRQTKIHKKAEAEKGTDTEMGKQPGRETESDRQKEMDN